MKNLPTDDVKALYSKVKEAGSIVIVSHIHPDGDAVGSCVALYSYLKSIGVDSTIILPQRQPECVDFLMEEDVLRGIMIFDEDKERAAAAIAGSDLIFFLDINDPSRTGDEMGRLLEQAEADKILIDHHLNPDESKFRICFSETEISSACELLYFILLQMPGIGSADRLPKLTATALMTGMTTDTNNFANSVFSTTFEMASAMIAAGVDRDSIIGHIFQEYRENRIRMQGYLLNRCLHITPDGVAYMVLSRRMSRKFDLQDGDTEGFVNIPLSVASVRMSILLKEEKDKFRVSIRSKKGTSANRCATKYFRGGGHELASGGKLLKPDDVTGPKDAAEYIEKVTKEFFKQG